MTPKKHDQETKGPGGADGARARADLLLGDQDRRGGRAAARYQWQQPAPVGPGNDPVETPPAPTTVPGDPRSGEGPAVSGRRPLSRSGPGGARDGRHQAGVRKHDHLGSRGVPDGASAASEGEAGHTSPRRPTMPQERGARYSVRLPNRPLRGRPGPRTAATGAVAKGGLLARARTSREVEAARDGDLSRSSVTGGR